jgi:hypothetical protein
MQHIHDIHFATSRLASVLDDLAVRGISEFDPTYEELDREFAELRLQLGNA